MRIGLVDVDGFGRKKKWGANVYPNIALAKISRYHKERGDEVEWAAPLAHYDVVYKSKIFSYSHDDGFVYDADRIMCGGTGYDIDSRLPEEVDRLQPDYAIYPQVPDNYAYGFLTRGCPNKCPWCVVPKKEGLIKPYMDCDEIAIEGRNHLVLMDNNILASGDYAKEQLEKIASRGYVIDFNQAMDARLMTVDYARLLVKCKWIGNRIRFGCDTTAQIVQCERAMGMLAQEGFRGEFFLYTMIGGKNDFEESFNRVDYWHKRMKECRKNKWVNTPYPYVQPYRDLNNAGEIIPQWQKDMARWCNKRMVFCSTEFADFSPRKGFKCEQFFNQ